MRNLLLLLVLANILYFIWGRVIEEPPERGIVILEEGELGPPLAISDAPEASASFGAMAGASRQTDFAAVVGRSCVSIGPFTNGPDAERALQEYRDEGMRGSVRATEGQLFVGHWVQIRDVPSREAADAMLAKLIAGGLTDAYLVPTEDEGLKISLGLFGDIARAERVELQAESLNLPAEIAPRMRDATVYFVDIALPPGRGAGAMIERYGEEKVMLREAATCPGAG
jgi:hypothetical protein